MSVLEEIAARREAVNTLQGPQRGAPTQLVVRLVARLGAVASSATQALDEGSRPQARTAAYLACRSDLIDLCALTIRMIESLDGQELALHHKQEAAGAR